MTIPKIIWQSWKTKEVHPVVSAQINKIRRLNPDYKYHLFLDEDLDRFVHTEFYDWPDVIMCYNKLNIIAARVDFWRYLVLYKYGGVYLDIDSSIEQPLDLLIRDNDNAIISQEGNPGKLLQWALIFSPNHPILKYTIDIVIDNIKYNRFHNDIMNMTGPVAFTRGVNKYHEELYGDILISHNHIPDKSIDIVYGDSDSSYRIFGIDYNGFFTFKYKDHRFLYFNVPNWRDEIKTKNLLR